MVYFRKAAFLRCMHPENAIKNDCLLSQSSNILDLCVTLCSRSLYLCLATLLSLAGPDRSPQRACSRIMFNPRESSYCLQNGEMSDSATLSDIAYDAPSESPGSESRRMASIHVDVDTELARFESRSDSSTSRILDVIFDTCEKAELESSRPHCYLACHHSYRS